MTGSDSALSHSLGCMPVITNLHELREDEMILIQSELGVGLAKIAKELYPLTSKLEQLSYTYRQNNRI